MGADPMRACAPVRAAASCACALGCEAAGVPRDFDCGAIVRRLRDRDSDFKVAFEASGGRHGQLRGGVHGSLLGLRV